VIRYLWDESTNQDVLRAVRGAWPQVDILSIQEAGRRGASDEQVIDLSIQGQRVIVTADRRTLLALAEQRIEAGVSLPGVVVRPH
jgi:predicted nuclease of predicted toxin-antitoxin system